MDIDIEFLLENKQKLLRAKDVALVLNISKAMAYRLVQQGQIPSVRIGNSVRVLPTDLEAYIRDNHNDKS